MKSIDVLVCVGLVCLATVPLCGADRAAAVGSAPVSAENRLLNQVTKVMTSLKSLDLVEEFHGFFPWLATDLMAYADDPSSYSADDTRALYEKVCGVIGVLQDPRVPRLSMAEGVKTLQQCIAQMCRKYACGCLRQFLLRLIKNLDRGFLSATMRFTRQDVLSLMNFLSVRGAMTARVWRYKLVGLPIDYEILLIESKAIIAQYYPELSALMASRMRFMFLQEFHALLFLVKSNIELLALAQDSSLENGDEAYEVVSDPEDDTAIDHEDVSSIGVAIGSDSLTAKKKKSRKKKQRKAASV
ncbi:MAG: hypothetical protein QG604_859 [Candidatus Dependentiae bacterium]|nr:hypothetical protein [Candidatus Dependentiae bacterium]